MRILALQVWLILFFTFISLAHAQNHESKKNERYAIYYSDQATSAELEPYQLLVLDQTNHPPLQPLIESGKQLLGYISLGEIDSHSPYFSKLKQSGLILEENKNWKGSYTIDLRNPLWAKFVIEEIIPIALRAGFNGLFFDTLDSPLDREENDPTKFKGMRDAAVSMLQAIHMHYPQTKIMVNRAYAILPRIAPYINMELGESVFADYDFDKKSYGRVDAATYNLQLKWLKAAQQQKPGLKIYVLDYANPNDQASIQEIYAKERSNGFIPYVATVNLDKIVKEPVSDDKPSHP